MPKLKTFTYTQQLTTKKSIPGWIYISQLTKDVSLRLELRTCSKLVFWMLTSPKYHILQSQCSIILSEPPVKPIHFFHFELHFQQDKPKNEQTFRGSG